MDLMTPKVIGIVGGMGPQAGNTLFEQIILHTPAKTDQEHLSVLLASFPSTILDRTAYLNGQVSENPAYAIEEVIKKLETAGAQLIGMACNTSHVPAIMEVIQATLTARNSKVELLHMPLKTCLFMQNRYPTVKKIGVLATNGVFSSKLYYTILEDMGYDLVVHDSSMQDQIHRIIYDQDWGLKAHPEYLHPQALSWLNELLDYFIQQGTDALILGCTEFSVAFRQHQIQNILLIDSTQCLAMALVNEAFNQSDQIYAYTKQYRTDHVALCGR